MSPQQNEVPQQFGPDQYVQGCQSLIQSSLLQDTAGFNNKRADIIKRTPRTY